MTSIAAQTRTKKATNVTLDAEMLYVAKALKISISKAAEDGVAQAIANRRAEIWLKENQAALESSNLYVERNGLPLARFRNF